MSWTFVNSASAAGPSSGNTSLGATLSGSAVQAGDLVVVSVASYNAATSATGVSDGTSAFTSATNHFESTIEIQFWYLLASVATGTPTYTASWGGAGVAYANIVVQVWRPTGTPSFDVEDATGNGFSTTSVSTGNITTTGTDELVIAASANDNAATSSSPVINGGAASNATQGSGALSGYVWANAFGSTFTSNGTSTLGAVANWAANIISFTQTAATATLLGQCCL